MKANLRDVVVLTTVLGLLLGGAAGTLVSLSYQMFPRGVGIGLGAGFLIGLLVGLLLDRRPRPG